MSLEAGRKEKNEKKVFEASQTLSPQEVKMGKRLSKDEGRI